MMAVQVLRASRYLAVSHRAFHLRGHQRAALEGARPHPAGGRGSADLGAVDLAGALGVAVARGAQKRAKTMAAVLTKKAGDD